MKFILNWFNQIFGRRRPKLPPNAPLPINLRVFTIAQAEKWKNFLAAGNLLDKDRTIKVSLRIRPPNDGELAMDLYNSLKPVKRIGLEDT